MSLVSYIFHFFLCSIKLTTYDIVKRLISASEKEFQTIAEENRIKHKNTNNQWYWTSNSYCFSQFSPWKFCGINAVTIEFLIICGYYFSLYLRIVMMIIHLPMLLHQLAENFVGCFCFVQCNCYILLMKFIISCNFSGMFYLAIEYERNVIYKLFSLYLLHLAYMLISDWILSWLSERGQWVQPILSLS